MPKIALAVVLIGFELMVLNLFAFLVMNRQRLIESYSRYKRKKQIDEMLIHAVNKIEIRNNKNIY